MRMTSFIKIIELQFPDVVCKLVYDDTSCVLKQIDPERNILMRVGYLSSWNHNTHDRKRTKDGSVKVTYIRNCPHKGIRTLAILHGIKLLDTQSSLERITL